jgi:glutathione S-transferase
LHSRQTTKETAAFFSFSGVRSGRNYLIDALTIIKQGNYCFSSEATLLRQSLYVDARSLPDMPLKVCSYFRVAANDGIDDGVGAGICRHKERKRRPVWRIGDRCRSAKPRAAWTLLYHQDDQSICRKGVQIMKLYYSPGACSLADHIALHEADIAFERIRVDLKTKLTETGQRFDEINAKRYVPTLELDDGERLTENVAILWWVAQRQPSLSAAGEFNNPGEFGKLRLLEMLAFISSEIHKQFGRVFKPDSDAEASAAREKISQRFQFLSTTMKGDYLFGAEASVADAYLFTMLLWANKVGLEVPQPLADFVQRMRARPAVQLALKHEGIE